MSKMTGVQQQQNDRISQALGDLLRKQVVSIDPEIGVLSVLGPLQIGEAERINNYMRHHGYMGGRSASSRRMSYNNGEFCYSEYLPPTEQWIKDRRQERREYYIRTSGRTPESLGDDPLIASDQYC